MRSCCIAACFASVGTAEVARIEADFTGIDCQLTTFTGSIVLTKD